MYHLYNERYFKESYGEWSSYERAKEYVLCYYLKHIRYAMRLFKIHDLKGFNCLDIGCAYGYGLSVLKNLGARTVVGIDISSYAIKVAKNLSRESFLICDAEKLPFKDGQFDLITCFHVLEHLKSPELAIAEMYRCLKNGGILVITTPNKARPLKGLLFRKYREEHHISEKTLREWREILSDFNFHKLKIFLALGLGVPTISRITNKFPIIRLPRFGTYVAIFAKKR